MAQKIAAGNWKMNGSTAALAEIAAMASALAAGAAPGIQGVICPPMPLVGAALSHAQAAGGALKIGGQDCHAVALGAHTGDVSAEILADAGARYVILGHSERRRDHGEASSVIAAKVQAAWRADLVAILCVGETEAQYRAGETLAVISESLVSSLPQSGVTATNLVVAYEPVWAIGTGLTPSLDEIAVVHGFLRAELNRVLGPVCADEISLLYGGSVNAANASDIFGLPDVDGGLVGGASLRAQDFMPIMAALSKQVA